MFKKIIYLLLIVLSIQSCKYFETKKKTGKNIIARVGETYLYKKDLDNTFLDNYMKSDSLLIVQNYIETWARQQLLFSKAKININENQEEIQKLVEKYRKDLLINKYKQAIISQKLDTVINENDFDTFYNQNKEIFKLNEKLLKFKFLQISKGVNNFKRIKKSFISNKHDDLLELEEKGLVFKSYHFNDSTWIKYTDVLKLVPVFKNIEKKIVAKAYIETKDDADIYLIKINKILKRNNSAPKSYVKPTIRQMILHNRKLLLLKELEKTLLSDATKNGTYEIYN